eukprot:6094903-Alexandrium_andersonii.AAC.1
MKPRRPSSRVAGLRVSTKGETRQGGPSRPRRRQLASDEGCISRGPVAKKKVVCHNQGTMN